MCDDDVVLLMNLIYYIELMPLVTFTFIEIKAYYVILCMTDTYHWGRVD